MKQTIYIFLLLAFGLFSCEKDDPVPDRDKFIGTYSGSQTIELHVNNQLIDSNTQTSTETIDAGSLDDEIIIGKGSEVEVEATVNGTSLSIRTQPVFVLMEDGEAVFFMTDGNGTLNGSTLTINIDMEATIDGDVYNYVITEVLVKN